MKLTFPFRNMAINDLLRFIDAYKFLEYIDVQKNNDPNVASYFNPYLEMYDSGLANFENELIQVINTTDQATIAPLHRIPMADQVNIDKQFAIYF